MAQASPPPGKGEKRQWGSVLDKDCLGRDCLNMHSTAIRGATGSGSRTVGYRFSCATRDYYGCPYPIPVPDDKLAKASKAEGWAIHDLR